jgi:transcriptional regulator with GAF, ATPase, and Fis domain
MSDYAVDLENTGLEVIDLENDAAFAARKLHERDVVTQMQGMQRLTHAFVRNPETILQELVRAAVELCGADSAGISMQHQDRPDSEFYHWVATAGVYSGFLDAILPRHPSACGVCLDRGRPQLFRVSKRFFDIMGIEAPEVADGILLPWNVDGMRGTIFIMAHQRAEAFDSNDAQMMKMLADFAAMAVRHQRQQSELVNQAKATAAAAMANDLAHEINNPLQGLTNVVYLAAEGVDGTDAKSLAREVSGDLQRLSTLVQRLLTLPTGSERVQ